ncbi:oligosaccharide flippase family protein [uncultured Leuconostoc sp.]|uniref:oligosaccharide flippase family protein n=1 Tax=uncultured Leuconostoc sp. TaxID=173262 RepID=UPI00280574DC|nr:oligosaccharide flippase family protein [uncultured Leuconostoc sp.]
MSKIGTNLIYQSSYQVLRILMPIITIPIVSHALGADGIGQYAYANSIAQYFVLITALGLPLYGTREIAKTEREENNLSKTFWTLEGFSLLLTLIVLPTYLVIGFVFKLGTLFLIQSLLIVGTGLDISWFFMGMEDFKKVTIVNFLVQVVGFCLILFYIRSSDDLIIYTIILTIMNVMSSTSLWFFIKDKIHFVKPKFLEMWQSLKSCVVLFIPQVAIVLYTNLNKTMLGILDQPSSVGIFSNSLLVTTVFVTLISSVDTVLMPRATRLFHHEKYSEGYAMIKKVLDLEIYFTIAISAGIMAISKKLVPWFFGNSFEKMELVLPILGLLVIAIPGGMTLSRQYLIPQGRIREYNKSVYFGAVLSVCINLFLIPVFGIMGAVFVSVLVEVMIWVIRLLDFKKNTKFSYSWRQITLNFLSAIVMIFSIFFITQGMPANLVTTIVQVLIGIFIYAVLTSLLRVNPVFSILKEMKK